MPNGWYPVAGLDVVLLNRTEQRYPRHEWDASWSTLWAVQFRGPRGYAPQGDFRFSPTKAKAPINEMIEAARAVVAADSMQGTASASVMLVDFDKKTGFACGSFSVYGWKGGSVSVLVDFTLGAEAPPDLRAQMEPMHLTIQTSQINAEGLLPKDASKRFRFEFADMDALVVSSEPLHYDAHWPAKNSLDCVAIALAQPRRGDTLVALWKAGDQNHG